MCCYTELFDPLPKSQETKKFSTALETYNFVRGKYRDCIRAEFSIEGDKIDAEKTLVRLFVRN